MKNSLLTKLLKFTLPIIILPLIIIMIYYYIYLNKILENDVIKFQKESLNDIAYDIKESINDTLKLESHLRRDHISLPKLRIYDKERNIIAYNFNMKNIDLEAEEYNRKILENNFKIVSKNNNENIFLDQKNDLLIKPIVINNEIVAFVTSDYKSTIDKKILLINQTFMYIFFIIIFTVFIASIFIIIFYLELLQPLKFLIDGIKKITAGDKSFIIDNNSNDEIGVVIDAFNKMIQKHNELEEMAMHDGLTGLYNHKFFYSAFENEISRGARYSKPTSLLLIDIDKFKNVNDTYGHIAGDMILIELSQRLMKRVRTTDYVCRYGGEEFGIILVETDITVAKTIAEELCLLVEKEPFLIQDGRYISLTVSIGISAYSEEAKEVLTIFSNADNALYVAKNGGRNQVCVFEKSNL